MKHYSTKTYGHELGLSAVFRQWRADSHCQYLHGYALGFSFKFGCDALDKNGWVMDFGALKKLKEALIDLFDHKILVADDDPQRDLITGLRLARLAQTIILKEGVGCEAFARYAFGIARDLCNDGRVHVISCECREHAGNSAIYSVE